MKKIILSKILLLLFLASSAQSGWQDVGDMPKPMRQDKSLVFKNSHSIVSVTVISDDMIRVRYYPNTEFERDHSYAVINKDFDMMDPQFKFDDDQSSISTKSLQVLISHEPFRVTFKDNQGTVLNQDDQARGMAAVDGTVHLWKRLNDQEHIYGLGEKGGRLDKRGLKQGGYNYSIWNSDTFGYDTSIDPIYMGVPFYLVLNKGRSYGIFLDNTFRSNFDIGHQSPDLLAVSADGGEMDYYFINGPDPKSVIRNYTKLTGRMPLPPRWALGYNQSRYSYYPEEEVRFVAQNFRIRNIPADVIFADIHHQQGYAPFTWNKDRFPDPLGLTEDLKEIGFRLVTPVDPHPKILPGHFVYEQGIAGDHFIKYPDGSVYEAPVWPSEDQENPANSVFPDFSNPATRDWYGGLYKERLEQGVSGIWIDMNEPAVFNTPNGTFPMDVVHNNEGRPTTHKEIHNVYGLLSCRTTYEGIKKLQPNSRPFILSRSGFAGTQRYAALWPGDDNASWVSLRNKIPMLCGMGLSGLAFVGADIGGYATTPSAELLTRWLQMAIFNPYMRNHSDIRTERREPWAFGIKMEKINRRAIELRYELLPHIYNEFKKATESGLPIMRPLLLNFPEDPSTYTLEDQFAFGEDLLIAPVVRESVNTRKVYLPPGDWYDYWDGKHYSGNQTIILPVSMESIPIFVKAGGFIFSQPVIPHTGKMPGNPLHVVVYPSTESEASLYEDDGETTAYLNGSFIRRSFNQSRDQKVTTIEVVNIEGSFQPADRALLLKIHHEEPVNKVLVNNREIQKVSDLNQVSTGWDRKGAFISIKLKDSLEEIKIQVEK